MNFVIIICTQFDDGVRITRRKKDHREGHVVAEYAEELIRHLKYMDFNDIDIENPEYVSTFLLNICASIEQYVG